jgi:hypothetical protein
VNRAWLHMGLNEHHGVLSRWRNRGNTTPTMTQQPLRIAEMVVGAAGRRR